MNRLSCLFPLLFNNHSPITKPKFIVALWHANVCRDLKEIRPCQAVFLIWGWGCQWERGYNNVL